MNLKLEVVCRLLDDFRIQVDQVLPALQCQRQTLQVLLRLFPRRILSERPRIGHKRIQTIFAALFVQTGNLVQKLDLANRVARVTNHDLVDADEVRPVRPMLVNRLQNARDIQL